jgi:hypothetical protein
LADEVVITQGAVAERRFVAVYGRRGRVVAAVAVDMPRALAAYGALIAAGAPFPPALNASDAPAERRPIRAGVPVVDLPTHSPTATPTGPGPSSPPPPPVAASDPRVPPVAPPL